VAPGVWPSVVWGSYIIIGNTVKVALVGEMFPVDLVDDVNKGEGVLELFFAAVLVVGLLVAFGVLIFGSGRM
jgi:hypothetical protein